MPFISLNRILHLVVLIVFCTASIQAQELETTNDTSASVVDSLKLSSDSSTSQPDSLALIDSIANAKPKRKSSIDEIVDYNAVDSMLFDLKSQKVYLYGQAVAVYGDIKLEADYIEIELGKSELMAHGMPDTNGEMQGLPIFTQGENLFRSSEMRYNFKSKRGLSKDVKTQESDGYLHGKTVKRDTGEVIYIQDGKYTTCEYDDPHFYIKAKKLKVIPNDKIITGPAFLSIAEIPTPLALPFGLFPNSDTRSNGIIIPSYGQNSFQGFFLQNGGYYMGLNDYADLSLTGDIYTRGSWATYASSRYIKRYKYRGSLNLGFISTKYSEKIYEDYSLTNSFKVNWTHTQDPKAKPNSSFNASVNAGSVGSTRANPTATQDQFLQSSLNSQIRYNYNFQNSPFSMAVSARATQNTQDSTISATLPSALLTMNRVFPFKKKVGGKKNVFTDIGINANLEVRNEILAREDTLFSANTLRNMKNGVQLNIPTISTSFKTLKFITVSPSLSSRIVGYLNTQEQIWNPEDTLINKRRIDKPRGFWEGNAAISATTRVFGLYQFGNGFFQALRHVITPNVSASWKPDYSEPSWGYYGETVYDTLGNVRKFSYFEDRIYGAPGAQENGVLNFSIQNIFEAKIRDRSDSTESNATKKIKLLDAFNFNTSYNLSLDSFNWAPLSISARTTVLKGLTANASSVLNPYATNDAGAPINQWQFDKDGKLGRWTNANIGLTWSLRPREKKKKDSGADIADDGEMEDEAEEQISPDDKRERLLDQGLYYTDFVDFDIPWNVNFSYNLAYAKPGNSHSVRQTLSVRGDINVTRNWKVGYSTAFDIKNLKITTASFDIYRDLHCWEISAMVIPFGPQQSYRISINAKPGILQDLKLNRQRNFQVPGYQ